MSQRGALRLWLLLALGALLVAVLAGALRLDRGDGEIERRLLAGNVDAMLARRAAFYRSLASRYDEDGCKRLGPPAAGEWLAVHAEPGQTFAEFERVALRATSERREMVLQPYAPTGAPTAFPTDPRGPARYEAARVFNAAFFGLPTRLARPVALPKDAYNPERRQYLGDDLLSKLAATRPAGALVHAGICDHDLYSAGTTSFVFGVGRLSKGVGVYSFARFGGPRVSDALYLRRCLKLLSHELGHSLGLKHCIYYRCGMNGSNSLMEMDAAPVSFCPVCLRKLVNATGVRVLPRYRALVAFYAEHGLDSDAAWVRARIAHLEGAGRAVPWTD